MHVKICLKKLSGPKNSHIINKNGEYDNKVLPVALPIDDTVFLMVFGITYLAF